MTYLLRTTRTLVAFLSCATALGCADDTDGDGGRGGGTGLDGEFVFACDNPAGTNLAAPVHGCADYFASTMGDVARVPLEQSCTINGGTVREEPCVDPGKVGACLIITPGTEAFGLYSLDWLYTPSNAAEVQDSCFDGGYDFVQPDGTVVMADAGAVDAADAAVDSGSTPTGGSARARVMNAKEDLTLAIWVAGADMQPVRVVDELPFGSTSDYFDVPFESSRGEPWFISVSTEVRPEAGQTFAEFYSAPDSEHQGVRTSLDPGTRITALHAPTDNDSHLGVGTYRFEEHTIERPIAAEARVAFQALFMERARLAVVGQPCLSPDPVTLRWISPLLPGRVTLGAYFPATVDGPCEGVPETTIDLDLQGGTVTLVMLYADGDNFTLKSAPIELD